MVRPLAIDLYCGLGGWTEGLLAEGYRVVGTGREGTLTIPASIANKFPAVVSLRVLVLNANGKAYTLDKVYRLVQ